MEQGTKFIHDTTGWGVKKVMVILSREHGVNRSWIVPCNFKTCLIFRDGLL